MRSLLMLVVLSAAILAVGSIFAQAGSSDAPETIPDPMLAAEAMVILTSGCEACAKGVCR